MAERTALGGDRSGPAELLAELLDSIVQRRLEELDQVKENNREQRPAS